MGTSMIGDLFDALREDHGRRTNTFSQDIQDANAVLHHPFAWDDELVEVMRAWSLKRQPCQFGRVAAKSAQIHICVLRERDLRAGDEGIRSKIAEEKRLWKQRAADDRRAPPHGFMLLFASPRIAAAAPDDNLYRFACHLRDLAGWASIEAEASGNPITGDYLYLKHPDDGFYYGFKFNIDFFAAAGDGRWWHDHRAPGGIAFTANSTGHMLHFKEWYDVAGQDQGEWVIMQAMKTIAHAHPTSIQAASAESGGAEPNQQSADPIKEGRGTWLLDLVDGRPMVDVPCPFQKPIPRTLQGKDWTRYAGLLHTDHNVRKEFFEDRPTPSTRARPYLNDFTYIYDKRQSDYVRFMEGIRVAEEDVYDEIGRPETWRVRSAGQERLPDRMPDQSTEIQRLIEDCRRWKVSPNFIDPLNSI
jgi:hypothetical protein